jgi:hypothetical protein
MYPGLVGGLGEMAKTGGMDEEQLNHLRTTLSEQASTGGYGGDQLANLRTQFGTMAAGGGYDPNAVSGIRAGMGRTFGAAEAGYGNYARTGGFTPGQSQAFIRSSTAGTSGIYDALRANLARRQAQTGGYAPGFTSSTARLTREAAGRTAEADTAANVALQGQIRAGREAGLGGLVTTGAQRAGLETGLESGIAAGRRAGVTGAAGLEGEVAAGRRATTTAQAGLETTIAQLKQAGYGQMANLFSGLSGQAATSMNQIIQSYQSTGQLTSQDIANLTQMGIQPGLFSNIMKGISTGVGAVVGIAGICWIAAAIYGGWDDPRTIAVRSWLLNWEKRSLIGKVVVGLYRRFGERIAKSSKVRLLKPLFDIILRKATRSEPCSIQHYSILKKNVDVVAS